MTMFDRNCRETFLTEKFVGYLNRKVPPRNFTPEVQADEMASLLRCLMRFAPKNGYEKWWPNFEDRLDEEAKTRAWPTGGEIKATAVAISGPSYRYTAKGDEVDILDVIAERMKAGEHVPEAYVFGPSAVELKESGKVSEDQIQRYRKGLFYKLKDTYGEATALAKIADLQARHDTAEAAAREPFTQQILPKVKPNLMVGTEWDGLV
ncbi:hypothetical protein [Ruegeria aquimaris]|uniref:Uncharacterized protein n=1 Tax=Ruegeria aquimaris TaxID=2984333 RepID=A0ABT3ARG2_9RHOB|nr:hypothetical protein [Ruegeria sp. XHP0148]MCV2891243.1 hypothetical protein [Ruegeria sp. XHP0148]